MAGDRVAKVSLIMQAQQFLAEAEKVRKKTAEAGSEAEKLGAQKQAFQNLGTAAVAMGTLTAVGVGLAIAKYAEFDAQMSSVQAATHASAEEQKNLRDAAIEAGATTVFTATEAAQAVEELAKAGVSTSDVLSGGLAGSLALASAGQLDMGRAAEIAATALTQFRLRGEDIPHVADLLAAGAGKAQGSVEDLSQALNQGGLVAAQTGLTIEETTGTLSAFASAGLLGSDAGTSFKTMLQRLTPQSAEARDEMERLGISAYDAQGQFIGMEKFAGNLQGALKDLTPEQRNASLSIIFGSDAVRAASVVYQQGAMGIREWINNVDDTGYAAETARLKLDNLSGDVEKLGGAFDTALIQTGSTANEVLRGGVQIITSLIDGYNQLPGPIQAAVLGVGALTASVTLGGGAALLAIPKYAEFITSLNTMGPKGQAAAKGIQAVTSILTGPWGLAMAAGMGAFIAWNAAQQQFVANAKSIADTLDQQSGAITQNTKDYVANRLAAEGGFEAARKIGIGQRELTRAVLEGGPAFEEINKALTEYNNGAGALDIATGNGINSIRGLRRENEESGRIFTDVKLATEGATQATEDSAVADAEKSEALATLAGKAQSAAIDISALAESIRSFASGELDARAAAREFEAAVDAVAEAVEKNGATLDLNTAAGRENEASLDALASKSTTLAAAILERGGSEDEARAAVQRGREELIRSLEQFGITGQAAEDYANRLGLIPSNITTAVDVNTSAAQKNLDTWLAVQSQRVLTIQTRASLPKDLNGSDSGSGRMGTFASGGFTGRGGKYEPAGVVHRGEYVFSQAAVNRIGVSALEAAHSGALRGYAAGGYVSGRDTQYARSGTSMTSGQQTAPGGAFVGNLYLDSGEFLGKVRGEVNAGVNAAFSGASSDLSQGYGGF